MTRSVTFQFDTNAASLVSANRRIHWAKRAELQRHWRTVAKVAAMPEVHAWGGFDLAGGRTVTITAEVRYPDNRRRDTHNLVPLVVKPCIDGIADAGLLPDDSDKYVSAVVTRRAPETGPYRVTLTVERDA